MRVEGSGNGKVALRRLKPRNPGDTSPQCRFCGESTHRGDKGGPRKAPLIPPELSGAFLVRCPGSAGICGGCHSKLHRATNALKAKKAQALVNVPSRTESPLNGAAAIVQQGSSGDEGATIRVSSASDSSSATMEFPGSSSVGTDESADSEANGLRSSLRLLASMEESPAAVQTVRQSVTATVHGYALLTPIS